MTTKDNEKKKILIVDDEYDITLATSYVNGTPPDCSDQVPDCMSTFTLKDVYLRAYIHISTLPQ